MKNTISRKIIASLVLAVYAFTQGALTVTAMENVGISQYDNQNKPILRIDDELQSLKLRGDVSFTTKNIPISMSLRDSEVKQVLRMFADKAGLNVIFHSSVDGKVTLDLVDVPLNSAFEMVMEISDLTYVINGKTLIVASSTAEDFKMGKQEMTLIPVKYIDASTLATFLNKNIYGAHKPGFSGTNTAVTNPSTNEILIFGSKNDVDIAKKVVAKFDRKPTTTVFRVNHTTPAEMADMICNMLLPTTSGASSGGGGGSSSGGSSSGGSSSGGSSSGGDSGSGSGGAETGGAAGIVTGGAAAASGGSGGGGGGEITLNAGALSCSFDTKVDAGSFSSLGLQNLSVAYYTQLGTINVMGGSEQQIEMIKDFIQKTDKKQPQAYLEMSIVELSESGSKTFDNTWQVWSKYFSASFADGQTGTMPAFPTFFKGDSFDVMDPDDPSKVDHTISRYSGAPMITYTINYLIENQKGRVVANPRILITNGQASTIDLTSDYVKTVKSEVLSGGAGVAGGVQKTYEIGDDNGIKIEITPFISPEGYVTLNITPDYATIKERVYTVAEDGKSQDLQVTLLQRRNLELKNVRIKDGETLVIGGMIREEDSKTVKKIPVLGDLPGVGMFFRSTSSTKSKEEMVIMITPKILTDTEDAIGNENTL